MGQDSWNLQYGNMHPAKYRRGTHVDMHPDEGWAGPKMVPGYAGAYKNWKGKMIDSKTLKANGNPRTYGSETVKKSVQYVDEERKTKVAKPSRRKRVR